MPKTTTRRSPARLTVDISGLPADALQDVIARIPLEQGVSISVYVEEADESTFEEAAVYRTGGPLTEGGPLIGGTPPGGAFATAVHEARLVVDPTLPHPPLDREHPITSTISEAIARDDHPFDKAARIAAETVSRAQTPAGTSSVEGVATREGGVTIQVAGLAELAPGDRLTLNQDAIASVTRRRGR